LRLEIINLIHSITIWPINSITFSILMQSARRLRFSYMNHIETPER